MYNVLTKEGKYHWITVMQDTGHPGITSETIGTPQVVSFHGFNAFSSQKNTPDAFCTPVHPHDIITVKMMPPSGRAHPHAYAVQV